MKKLLGVIAIACIATSAFATPQFVLSADKTEVLPGESVWISISGTAPTVANGFQGLDLFASLDGPFKVTDLLVDQAGAGTGFVGNSSGATMMIQDNGALAVVTTSSGYVAPSAILAKVKVTANADAPVAATGVFNTDGSAVWGAPSDFTDGAEAAQASLTLKIVPEPVSALLLLAGLPFLRRRHA